MAASTPSESSIRDGCKRTFERAGAWVVVKHQTGRGVKGTPDLLVTYRSFSIPAEIKKPKGSTFESGQILQLGYAARAGGLACVLRSKEDAQRMIDAVDAWISLARPMPPPVEIVPEDLRPPKLERPQ
jgi:hypothetical protein